MSEEITEKDRSILQYLEDVKLSLHETGFGYTLTFVFESNSYFAGTELKKEFIMTKPNVVEKCIGTTIEWAAGCDPTKEKKKKKVKQGGKPKTVTTTVKCQSFFNFFNTVEAADINKKPGDEDSEGEDNEIGEQMDHDFDMGNDIKDDLVPLALEYFLGVIEKEEEADEDDEDGDDDDSDEDEKPKKKKNNKKGGPGGPGGPPQKGPNGEECKQQ